MNTERFKIWPHDFIFIGSHAILMISYLWTLLDMYYNQMQNYEKVKCSVNYGH